jgi:MarR family transcriptional regulator, organic hydroperoxide resistance regulator
MATPSLGKYRPRRGSIVQVTRKAGQRAQANARTDVAAEDVAAVGRPPLTVARPELLIDGSDSEFRKLVHGLFAFFAAHEGVRDAYAELIGLTGPQYSMLLCIRHLAPAGPVNVRDVADHLGYSGSHVTVETNKLLALDLIAKERGDEDRRRVNLTMTAKGARLLDGIAPLRRQVNDVQFGCLDENEFHALVPLIGRLTDSSREALSLLAYLHQRQAAANED